MVRFHRAERAEMIEMLFVRPDSMGKGYGSTLLRFAVKQKGYVRLT